MRRLQDPAEIFVLPRVMFIKFPRGIDELREFSHYSATVEQFNWKKSIPY